MAHFFPPEDREANPGETAMYAWLSQLNDDYTVYQHITISNPKGTDRELDFVVFHPHLGIIVLEVKGGDAYKATKVGGHKRQVRGATARLWDELLKDPTLAACFARGGLLGQRATAWAVCYPHGVRAAISDAAPGHTIAHDNESEQLAAFLRQLAPIHADPLFTDFERTALHDALWGMTSGRYTLAQRINDDRAAFNRLIETVTDEIDARMAQHVGTARLAVEGSAGTGKTVLAYRTAQRLAREGQRVLFLCASIGEVDMLRGDLHFDYVPYTPDPPFAIFSLEGWAQGVLAHAHGSLPGETSTTTKGGQLALAQMLRAALAGMEVPPRYDAILVDEAQDFSAPLWPIILSCLATPASPCYAFYDNAQAPFKPGFQTTYLGEDVPRLALTHNLRNTRAIYALMQTLNESLPDLPETALNPVGQPVRLEPPTLKFVQDVERHQRIKGVSDRVARRSLLEEAQIEHYLDVLIDTQKVPPNRILIISCRNQRRAGGKTKAPASRFFRRKRIGHHALSTLRASLRDAAPTTDDAVRISTLGAVKGLDSDVVILVEVDGAADNDAKRRSGYIAVSRARHALYILSKETELKRLFAQGVQPPLRVTPSPQRPAQWRKRPRRAGNA